MALAAPLFGGCATATEPKVLSRDAFEATYKCEQGPEKIRAVSEWVNGAQLVDVVGCGAHAEYRCAYARQKTGGNQNLALACEERPRLSFEATDGKTVDAWEDEAVGAAKGTALASASHDLPCPETSIVEVGHDTHGFPNVLDGCGKRVAYNLDDDGTATPSSAWSTPTPVVKYVLAGHAHLAKLPGPSGAEAAPAAGCGKDTDCKSDGVCVEGYCEERTPAKP
jgi:hypothetical protein